MKCSVGTASVSASTGGSERNAWPPSAALTSAASCALWVNRPMLSSSGDIGNTPSPAQWQLLAL